MRPIAAKGDRPKAGVAGDGTPLVQWPPGHVRGQLGLGLGHLGGALLWEHLLSAPTEPFLWDVCRSLHPAPLLIPRATLESPLPPQRPQWSPSSRDRRSPCAPHQLLSHTHTSCCRHFRYADPSPLSHDVAMSSLHFTGEEAEAQGSGEALPSGCRVWMLPQVASVQIQA